MLSTEFYVVMVITGVVSGFASGLLGLGGGFLMTPVQYAVYTAMGLPPDIAVKMSFATTMLVILPTSASGAWKHHQKGAVWWRAAIFMGAFTFVGSFVGATIASHLPGLALRIAFGVIAVIASVRMVTAKMPPIDQKPVENLWLWVAWAIPIGVITGILGVGGGVMLVPIMVLALKFPLHKAVATSLGMMLLTSTGGAAGYIVNGLNVPNLPAYSIGYVNLISFIILTACSIGMAQLGAVSAHKLPARKLNYVFSIIIFLMGLKMIGVFGWLGLPF